MPEVSSAANAAAPDVSPGISPASAQPPDITPDYSKDWDATDPASPPEESPAEETRRKVVLPDDPPWKDDPEDDEPPKDGPAAVTADLFTTAAEIAKTVPAEVTWVAKPVIAKGTITLIDGQPKAAGKSTFVMAMVGALLAGRDFLGQPTTKASVVYATEEDRRTFRRLVGRANAESDELSVFLFESKRGLTFGNFVDKLLAKCLSTGASVVVIDSLAQFAPEAEGSSVNVIAVFDELRRLTVNGITVVATRHTRKAGGPVGISGRGSSAGSAAVDCIIAVERPEGHSGTTRLLRLASRFEDAPPTMLIQREDDGTYTVLPGIRAVSLDCEPEILGVLPNSADAALRADEVLDATGLKKTTGREALARMFRAGRLQRTGDGTRTAPYRYYRRAEASSRTQATTDSQSGSLP